MRYDDLLTDEGIRYTVTAQDGTQYEATVDRAWFDATFGPAWTAPTPEARRDTMLGIDGGTMGYADLIH